MIHRMMDRKTGLLALMLGVTALGACGRLDHLGREPSFTELSRHPTLPPLNPRTEQQRPAPIADGSYGNTMRHARARQYGNDALPQGLAPASHASRHYDAPAPLSMYGGSGPPVSRGSLWSSGPKSLFGDRRAKKVGDILTVMIEIDDQAQLSNTTSRQRAGDEDASATALFGLESIVNKVLPGGGLDTGASLNSSSSASGKGQVKRNEAISLKIAARVIEVLPTGHLMITGRQEVRVNFELRDLQIVGLIRPEDVTRNNDITYDKMAEARISYGGRGHLTDVQQARYGQQVFDMLSPF